jgi:hypothetical protein
MDMNKIEELIKLKALLDDCVISQEEFDKLKSELLNPQKQSEENPKLLELKELLESGIVTKEEFENLKGEYIKNSSEKLKDDKQEISSSSDSEVSFEQKTYHFNTGVTVNVNKDTVAIKNNGGNASIDRRNLDNFSYQAIWEARISHGVLLFRFFGISLILLIIIAIILDNFSSKFLGGFSIIIIIIIINIIVLVLSMLDAMMQLNISENIIKNHFSNQAYSVSIGNKSGNNLDFYASLDEKSKIVDLERRLGNLKKL